MPAAGLHLTGCALPDAAHHGAACNGSVPASLIRRRDARSPTGLRRYSSARSLRSCTARADQQVDSGSTLSMSEDEIAAAAIPTPPQPDRSLQPGLVFPLGSPGAWDAASLGRPVVRCFLRDDEQRWCMWYSARGEDDTDRDAISPGAGSIGLATSRDGVEWRRGGGAVAGRAGAEEVGRVMGPNTEDWWTLDTAHLAVSDVQMLASSVVDNGTGVYWLFYAGGDFAETAAPAGLAGFAEGAAVESLRTRPGLAMSQDGRNWARIEGEHHSGALFDAGEGGEWDAAFVGAPMVVMASPTDFRMYYHSWDVGRQRFVVGFATSSDALRWRKQGPIFEGGQSQSDHDGGGAMNVHVIKDGALQRYLMFYEAVAADGSRAIGLAASKDGIRGWKRLDRPLLEGSKADGAWDGEVGGPCAVPMAEGRYRVYYNGRRRIAADGDSNKSSEGSSDGGRPWEGFGLALNPAEAMGQGQLFEGMRTDFQRLVPKQTE